MAVHTLDPDPTIEINFRGITITHIVDGNSVAQIGAVKEAPCHEAKIRVVEKKPDGSQNEIAKTADFKLDEDLFLDVENTSISGISTFEREAISIDEFDRFDQSAANVNDFRFHVDLERDIYKGKKLDVDQDMIGPVFTIQNAVFFTRFLTDKELSIIHKNGPPTEFGFAAEEISAQIKLDQPNSKAVLRNGNNVILTVDAGNVANGLRYVIDFDCECDPNAKEKSGAAAGTPGTTDFSLVHNAVGKNLNENEKKDILGKASDGGPTDPQVFCMGGNTTNALRNA